LELKNYPKQKIFIKKPVAYVTNRYINIKEFIKYIDDFINFNYKAPSFIKELKSNKRNDNTNIEIIKKYMKEIKKKLEAFKPAIPGNDNINLNRLHDIQICLNNKKICTPSDYVERTLNLHSSNINSLYQVLISKHMKLYASNWNAS